MSRAFLARMLTPEECSTELSTILEAKWLSLRSLPVPEPDNARVAREAAEAYEREVLRPIMALDGGYGEEFCDHPRTPPPADPWDLDESELNHTAALPRETPQWFGVDRGDFDPLDDKSDLSPHTREGKP